MCVAIFSATPVWNISHTKKKWARYDQKWILVFMESTRYYSQILMKPEFSRQIFEKKIYKYQISRKFVQWEPRSSIRTDGRTS